MEKGMSVPLLRAIVLNAALVAGASVTVEVAHASDAGDVQNPTTNATPLRTIITVAIHLIKVVAFGAP